MPAFDFDMNITDEDRETYGELADNLAAAYVAHMGGITIAHAKKKYGRASGNKLGDYWYLAAKRTLRECIEIQNYNHKMHAAGKKETESDS